MNLVYLLLVAAVASASASQTISADSTVSAIFDKLGVEDIKQYLRDSGDTTLLEKVGDSAESLRKLAVEQWEKNREPQPWWKVWKDGSPTKEWVNENFQQQVPDWYFETWSRDSLERLLKEAGIKVSPKASVSALVETARNRYNKIAKSLGVSKTYPSDKFFGYWTDEDLEEWLKEFGINTKDVHKNRDAAIQKVKENIAKATNYYEDEKYEFLTSLDLLNDDFERGGNLGHVDFNTWSPNHLRRWLRLHRVKLDNKMADQKDYLVSEAKKHKSYLDDDLDWLMRYIKKISNEVLAAATAGVDPITAGLEDMVNAAGEAGQKVFNSLEENGQVVNDTFSEDVEYWPKDRLKQYLRTRDISYPYLASRKHLLEIVRANKNKPLKKVNEVFDSGFEWFDNWASANVPSWSNRYMNAAYSMGNRAKQWSQDKAKDAINYAKSEAGDAHQKAMDMGDSANKIVQDASDNMHQKAKDIGNSANKKVQDAGDSVGGSVKSFGDAIKGKVHDWTDAFDSWSADDLQQYLFSFGLRFPPSFPRERLIGLAKSHSYSFFGVPKPEPEPPYVKYVPSKLRQWSSYGYSYLFNNGS